VAPHVPPFTAKFPPVEKLKFNVVLSLLVTVTDLDELFPTSTLPRSSVAGLKLSGVIPVPLRATSCGLLPALSSTVNAPPFAPGMGGAKATLIVQFKPALSEPGQLLVCVNPPLAVIEPIVSGFEPVFVRVTG